MEQTITKVETVAVYCRVSSDEQRQNRTIETQVSAAQSYIKLQKDLGNLVQLVDWYKDDGISGMIPLDERPEGKRLINDAREGKFTKLVVWRLDRLGRDIKVILRVVDQLESFGVVVNSITEQFDITTPSGSLAFNMVASFADYEHRTIIERSVAGTDRCARNGQWLGGIVPYGYRVVGVRKDARLEVCEEPVGGTEMTEAGVVRLIYKRLAEDESNCVKIAKELDKRQIPPSYIKDNRLIGKRKQRTSGIWRPARIRGLITNTVYKGIHTYGKRSKKKRELIEREVPAIVSAEVWDRAQAALKANMIFTPHGAKHIYPLKGLITCGVCGLHYCGCCYPRGERYYRCSGKTYARGLFKGRCPGKSIKAELLEDVVWDAVQEILEYPDSVIVKLQQYYLQVKQESVVGEAELVALEQELRNKNRERERVMDLFRKEVIEASDVESQLAKITEEERSLKGKIRATTKTKEINSKFIGQLVEVKKLLVELRGLVDKDKSDEMVYKVIRLLTSEIRVDTIGEGRKKQAKVRVTFAFDPSSLRSNYTDRGS